jgi:hypothetical protein
MGADHRPCSLLDLEGVIVQSESDRTEALFELHLKYMDLCARDIITETEHNLLEDALEKLLDD